MKIKFNTNIIINSIIIGIVLLGVASFVVLNFSLFHGEAKHGVDTAFASQQAYQWENNVKPIDGGVGDSIERLGSAYRNLKDSLKTIRWLRNGDPFALGSYLGCFGTVSTQYCDTCSVEWFRKNGLKDDDHQVYYISLLGWKIKNTKHDILYSSDSVIFHVEHGQSYIRKEVTFPKEKVIRLMDVPVKFRYHRSVDCLLIPVSKATEKTVSVSILLLGIVLILWGCFLIACFLEFIVDLSKGQSFTIRNVRRLKWIALTLLIYPVAMFVLNLLLRLIFASYFTPDVVLSETTWQGAWKSIGSGLIFLALYRAFKQGKKLKDEQDLTV